LTDLLQGYPSSPVLARRAMRELMNRMPGKFYAICFQAIQAGGSGPGYDYLMSMLIDNDQLALALADPILFTQDQALTLARTLYRRDSGLDSKLLRHALREQPIGPVQPPTNAELTRVLAVVDEISDSMRLVPLLLRLLRHEDDRIRSKAAK